MLEGRYFTEVAKGGDGARLITVGKVIGAVGPGLWLVHFFDERGVDRILPVSRMANMFMFPSYGKLLSWAEGRDIDVSITESEGFTTGDAEST